MRIDKYLKVSRILKRREVGKELALNDRLFINNKLAKPSSEVKVGDIVKIIFGNREISIEVLEIKTSASKAEAFGMYRVIDESK
ncbi:MAG: RNA-binding S4 domain-containing protein [Erysipelotrichaceae bacterium]|nr:RNA-binding S4 domain-containing protein [Erysipelotrichaceae bacterium]